ncbi:hypothetical protein CLG85_023645 [Yangia mangrovi]|uniref:Uncharacterized protein n=1 Tax=Alloyangia mangrovi TaxID=1779329 RepID=A0A2A3JZT3_9RHOB|nr:hypothetical protein [Alloyangia mangrovi]MCA0940856.1 hypothetical protein [Alloyangia pacifica]MCA0944206.1 hypothetical protein [Alloyangia pacifica]MCT4373124.1 hypothetical protein [Alloyangia mangrovi]
METIGYLKESGGRFEFHSDQFGLIVRGNYPEWVLAAAAEIIRDNTKLEADSRMEELAALVEFGEASEIDIDAHKVDMKFRYEVLPQCVVTMGTMDYRWADQEGREKLTEFDGHTMRRLHDMSLTRNDSFLDDEDGVDKSSDGAA